MPTAAYLESQGVDLTLRFRSRPPFHLQVRPGRLKLRVGDRGRRFDGGQLLAAQPISGGGGAALKVGCRGALRFPPTEDFGELRFVGLVVFAAAPSFSSHLPQK